MKGYGSLRKGERLKDVYSRAKRIEINSLEGRGKRMWVEIESYFGRKCLS